MDGWIKTGIDSSDSRPAQILKPLLPVWAKKLVHANCVSGFGEPNNYPLQTEPRPSTHSRRPM